MNRKISLLALVVTLVAGSLTGCSVLGGSTKTISADFSDSAGLFVGNDVGVRGVKIGRVTKIEPKGEGVTVTLELTADDVKIPVDAQAMIVSRSVATDRYVELSPAYSSGAELADGARIPLERTQTPVDFDEVLTAISDFSTGIAGSKDTAQAIRRFLKVGAETFGPNGDEMNRAITNLSEAVNGVSGQRDNIVSTMQSLDKLVATLVENKAVVQQFIDSVAATTSLLAEERTNFRNALVKLSRTVEVVAAFAKDNKAKLKGTVSDVADVSDILLSRQGQLAEFLETMPLVAQNLERIQVPSGIALVVPLGDTLLGPLGLGELCEQLPKEICELVGTDAVGPLVDLLTGLLGKP